MIWARISLALVALAAAALVSPSRAAADWRRAESQHFVIYSNRSEADVRSYVVMLEDFDALLRSRHPSLDETVVPPKLDVYLIDGISQLRKIWPGAPDNIGGFYSASNGGIYAVAVREGGGEFDQTSGDDVVLHEYVHHFMMQNHKAAYPAWLIEGYAEYYATVDLTPKKITIGSVHDGRAYSLTRPGWVDMAKVLSNRVNELTTGERAGFYAQSWLLTHYVLSDATRRGQLNTYLSAWRESGDSIAAWKKAFNEDPKQLRKTLDRYMSGPLMGRIITRNPPPPPPMTITRLSDGADDVLLEGLQLRRPVAKKRQADLLQRMRSVHARRPADRFARLAAARAEVLFGDRAAGEALLQTMIKEDASDFEAMIVLAESHMARGRKDETERQAQFATARRLLASAAKVQPSDYRIYLLTAQTRAMDPGPPTENTLNVLARAVQLAPQVRDLRMLAAVTYMRAEGTEAEVREMLEPLLSDPHGGRLTDRAQAMIAKLDGKEPPADAPEDSDAEEEEEEG